VVGKDHISLRSENDCQRDEVFPRFSVKVANLVAFKVGANPTFH